MRIVCLIRTIRSISSRRSISSSIFPRPANTFSARLSEFKYPAASCYCCPNIANLQNRIKTLLGRHSFASGCLARYDPLHYLWSTYLLEFETLLKSGWGFNIVQKRMGPRRSSTASLKIGAKLQPTTATPPVKLEGPDLLFCRVDHGSELLAPLQPLYRTQTRLGGAYRFTGRSGSR